MLLAWEARGASATELPKLAKLAFGTTCRLPGSLTRAGFVDHEPAGRLNRLGLRALRLGQQVSNDHCFARTAMPILQRVTDVRGEATILSVRDVERHLAVSKVDGHQTFRVTSDPGRLGLLHSTSAGRVLAALAAGEDGHRLVEELELGVSVPVLNGQGTAFASPAVAPPIFRLTVEAGVAHGPCCDRPRPNWRPSGHTASSRSPMFVIRTTVQPTNMCCTVIHVT